VWYNNNVDAKLFFVDLVQLDQGAQLNLRMYISKLVILVLLLIVAVAKAQLISELISFYSDAACTNQTGYLYSFSVRDYFYAHALALPH
jgi:hypothetical protein